MAWYVNHFETVELNRSFYRLPTRENFVDWREATPSHFRFAVKASRYITHMKKLKDPAPSVKRLLDAVAGLGARVGPCCSSSHRAGGSTWIAWNTSCAPCPLARARPSSEGRVGVLRQRPVGVRGA